MHHALPDPLVQRGQTSALCPIQSHRRTACRVKYLRGLSEPLDFQVFTCITGTGEALLTRELNLL